MSLTMKPPFFTQYIKAIKQKYIMSRHLLWKNVDNFKRKQFLKFEIKQLLLNSVKKNNYTSFNIRYRASFLQSKMFKNKSQNKVNNLCIISGRVKSVFKKTQYGRFVLRDRLYKAELPGFKRASW